MNDILAMPPGPLPEASLSLARTTESSPIADHSVRSFFFARLLAQHDGCLSDAAIAHGSRSPAAAPPYSIAAELIRQRQAES